mmetsp:Transcript_28234/g.59052  ORF Transcript_28234/g.59052 Transcript_28234/m.59052 type:complete len:352 (-) Transcript_28234:547-1602(-)
MLSSDGRFQLGYQGCQIRNIPLVLSLLRMRRRQFIRLLLRQILQFIMQSGTSLPLQKQLRTKSFDLILRVSKLIHEMNRVFSFLRLRTAVTLATAEEYPLPPIQTLPSHRRLHFSLSNHQRRSQIRHGLLQLRLPLLPDPQLPGMQTQRLIQLLFGIPLSLARQFQLTRRMLQSGFQPRNLRIQSLHPRIQRGILLPKHRHLRKRLPLSIQSPGHLLISLPALDLPPLLRPGHPLLHLLQCIFVPLLQFLNGLVVQCRHRRHLGLVRGVGSFFFLFVTRSVSFHAGGGPFELFALGFDFAFGGFEVGVQLEDGAAEFAEFFLLLGVELLRLLRLLFLLRLRVVVGFRWCGE